MAKTSLPSVPFAHFLRNEELDDFTAALVRARPELCQRSSIGKTPAGNDILLLTITDSATGCAQDKPAYLIHGNIHAMEVAGTHASLFTARQLLADHGKSDLLRRVAFYIIPRLNPDNAQDCLVHNAPIRSRYDRRQRLPNTLYHEDVDGDGLILRVRLRHPDGSLQLDPQDPRLLIPRRSGAMGPFFHQYPEGLIHQWDGSLRFAVENRSYDWNRNWSYDWRPEPEQAGAGDFPFSETEMNHLGHFLHDHGNLFAILGYHTGPAAILRPPSTGGLGDIDAADEQRMEDIARLAAKATGFPVIPVIKYHGVRSRDINLRGHFHNFSYFHLGLFAYEVELGTIMDSAGIKTGDLFAAQDPEQAHLQHHRQVLQWWDKQPRRSRAPLFVDWRKFTHPQLGPVEVGGFLVCRQYNPTLPDLKRISSNCYRFTCQHAQKHPQVVLEDLLVETVSSPAAPGSGPAAAPGKGERKTRGKSPAPGNVLRIRARVANRGELPTNVTARGKSLARLRPVRVEFHVADQVKLLSAQGHLAVGHLAGHTGSQNLEWFVAAPPQTRALAVLRIRGGAAGNSEHAVSAP